MKKLTFLSVITGLVLILAISVTFAWYVSGVFVTTPMIQSEDIEGLDLHLYRGFDYDFNGLLDYREFDDYSSTELNQLKSDFNSKYINMDTVNYDSISGIMDDNIITYRLIIHNNTDKEYNVNPYFLFKDDGSAKFSIYNSILFRLKNINIINHTFCDKNGNFIDYWGDEHFDTTNKKFYEIKISPSEGDINGLYDSYGNPIRLITNGNTYYRLEYDENNNFTHIYHEEELEDYTGTINLSDFYNSSLYKADGELIDEYPIYDSENEIKIYDTYYSKEYYLYSMEYNSYNKNGFIGSLEGVDDVVSAKYYYPSKNINRGINLAMLMYQENITDRESDISIDSYSEYFIDFQIQVSSSVEAILQALDSFALAHNVPQSAITSPDNSNKYEVAYHNMYGKYSELIKYSEITKPNFKITSFCFDMILKNGRSSYIKRKSGDES